MEGIAPLRVRALRQTCAQSILVAALTLSGLPTWAAERSLGGYPVCEASAALFVSCPHGMGPRCLLVGDNEQRQELFLYGFDGATLDTAARRKVDITPLLSPDDGRELSDIEALAGLSSGEILVFGSHSLNGHCQPRKKRRQYLGMRLREGTALPGQVRLMRTPKNADLSRAFGRAPKGDLGRVATAVRRASEEAETGRCEQAFNLEGAVVISADDGDQVWVGLRRPLIDGKAVLLRQDVTGDRLLFTDVRLLDLGGEGVRGLARDRGSIWGLSARPGGDDSRPFVLWRFPVDALSRSGTILVNVASDVPNSTEGLAISERRAVLLRDGMDGPGHCRVDARYVVIPVTGN